MKQTSIFEYLYEDYKIKKPIRLIELFAGYGSQLFALKYLGANVSSHKIVEWSVPSIQAYKDAHFHDRNDNHTSNKTFDDLVDELLNYGISGDYNKPMTRQQIVRKGLKWCKQVYNNIKNTDNLVNIMNVKGKDLEIEELDKYDYIMTYSFPCQDLSLAGKLGGMDEDSQTRSSMLWQVKRILEELKQENALPQVLLMENVPQVIGKGNIHNMEKWDLFLSRLGYKSYIKNMIATDYGIPQIRNRTFMISILGEYNYTFPRKEPLELKLSDLLEEQVDEKYFLSDKMIARFMTNPKSGFPRKEQFINSLKNTNVNLIANTITTKARQRPTDNFVIVGKRTKKYRNYISWEDEKGRINTQDHRAYDGDVVGTIPAMERGIPKNLIPEATKKGYAVAEEGDGVYINRPHQKRGEVQKGKIQPTKTSCDDIGVVVNYGIATNESHEWQKKPLEEKSRTILANKSNGGVGVVVKYEINGLETLTTRKLTPKECFRLMGVKDEDYQRIAANKSNSSLYHLAGDSIVVNVLMAIFKQLL